MYVPLMRQNSPKTSKQLSNMSEKDTIFGGINKNKLIVKNIPIF